MTDKSVVGISDLEMESLSDEFVPVLLKDVRAMAEKEAVLTALMHCKSISDAANSLGVSRPTLYNLISKYELEGHTAGKQEDEP